MRNSPLDAHPAALQLARLADPACALIGPQVPSIILSRWESERWVLPWSLLLSAKLENTSDAEYLRFTFTSQIAVVHGKKLELLLPSIACFRLAQLRELPVQYENQLSAKEPFISKIAVCEANRVKGPKLGQPHTS